MVAQSRWALCQETRAYSSWANDMSAIAKAEAALNKCGQRTRFIWLCTVVLLAMVLSSAAPSTFTDDLGVRWRPPGLPEAVPWLSGARDLERAMYRLPAVLSHPLELHWWPYKAVTPFRGPFLALVSTRPENVARRAAIRAGWGKPGAIPERLLPSHLLPCRACEDGQEELETQDASGTKK
ncbi:hypothetical protein MRX96_053377 [Rhipicephalus microplus]